MSKHRWATSRMRWIWRRTTELASGAVPRSRRAGRGGRSVNRGAGVARSALVEQLAHVNRVENVGAVAEITPHFDLATLGQDRAGFRLAQTLQHPAYAVTRTSASEVDRSRFKNPHVVFVEQPMHDLGVRQIP